MTKNNAHKFKAISNNASVYALIVYCEYCGHVAFNANHSSLMDQMQREAKLPCPLAPNKEEVSDD